MLTGQFFDGQSSRAHPVSVQWRGSQLHVRAEQRRWVYAAEEIGVSEPVDWAPRVLSFADGAYCELPETPALQALLHQLQRRDSWVVRAQRHFGLIIISALMLCAALVTAYLYGLPAAARWAAQVTPQDMVAALDRQGLRSLDESLFVASEVDHPRRERIQALLETLRAAQAAAMPVEEAQLHFRSSPLLGANALALPGGSIVVLDELLALADDAQVQAVLAHELGHVVHRHGLMLAYQNAAAAGLAGLVLGDFSALIAVLPGLVLHAHYARELEREADRYAVTLLHQVGADPQALRRVLETLLASHGVSSSRETSFLDSHPAPAERFAELDQMIDALGAGDD